MLDAVLGDVGLGAADAAAPAAAAGGVAPPGAWAERGDLG